MVISVMKDQEFFLRDRLDNTQIGRFLLFEDEELIFATREHWLPLALRLTRLTVVGIIASSITAIMFFGAFAQASLAIVAFLIIFLGISIAMVRDLIHWSFHLYIATNKQIIEVHYSPLFSHIVNSVLLDQIRCTEIDVEMHGIIPELIGIGNVELTFDRPTHKEQFVIRGIRSPRTIASLLSAQIHQGVNVLPAKTQSQQILRPLWTKELKKNKYKFLGEVSYGYSAG